MMKKGYSRFSVLIVILFVLLGISSSCKKNVTIDVKKTAVFKVPENTPVDIPYEESFPLSTASLEFSVNDIEPSEVRELYLQRLQLTITSPPGKNFDFLKSIKVYAYADGMPEILAGYVDDVPVGHTQLELWMTNASLAEIANKENFYIKAVATFDEAPQEEVYISTYMNFYIKAKVKVF